MSLAGRTLLITGASRGIGKAIGLRAARDGANVVVLGKTETPHPKLPGTVASAVEEIEQAGGRGLGCICDIRHEDQVRTAVERTREVFGGIDVVVNNASAIHLAGIRETSLKRFDLLQAVNVRGTFLVTQQCLPFLEQSDNPHVLVIAPPLNLEPRWFAPHLAYSLSKFGMSLCVLGLAEELREAGIAVNALWPRTAIATAAIRNLLGGEEAIAGCRQPEIMADAAHHLFTQLATDCTGNFFIDDEVLKTAGVTDLDRYAVNPGHELLGDFFVDP